MHFNFTSSTPQSQNTDKIIEQWLDERQQLIVLFTKLGSLRPFKTKETVRPLLAHFCETLVDYVSAGQFEVFEKIFEASGLESNPSPSFDQKSLVGLLRITMNALDFSDKYTKITDYDCLEKDLSFLGERFAQRLEIEDALIDLYIQAVHHLSYKMNYS